MQAYELVFETAKLSDAAETHLVDDMDAVVAVHSGVTRVSVEALGSDGVEAAINTVRELRDCGVKVFRIAEDLVTRRDIAERLGVTTQAVGAWVRDERLEQFPAPWNPVAGGIWLWGEVDSWATAQGKSSDGVGHLSRDDISVVNGLLSSAKAAPAGWTSVAHVRSQLLVGEPRRGTTTINSDRSSFTQAA